MTIFIRDLSDYDSNDDLTGFVGATNKASEGTQYRHTTYGPRLNRWRAQGYQVLGSYHVVRTPGNGGNGSLQEQLNYWFATMDAATPWWRSFPGFILQIDLERWPYDPVTLVDHLSTAGALSHADVRQLLAPDVLADLASARSSTGMAFAALVKAQAPASCWVVTYASRGQYGDSLAGIVTPLWNASYHSSTYPGDNAVDWAPYSGQTPTFWQFTSTPFDKNAFRGSLTELLTLIGGIDMATLDDIASNLEWQYPRLEALKTGQPIRTGPEQGEDMWINDQITAIAGKLAAGLPVTLSDAQLQELKAALPTAADVAAHLDLAALAGAVAKHIGYVA